MNKKQIQKLKERLEEDIKTLEEELKSIANKDPELKDDWDSKFPKFNGEFGGSAMEIGADEVEAYGNRLPVEYALELKLRDAKLALEKIKKDAGEYGKCEKCGKKIDEKRLEVYPAARLCMGCQKK